MQKNRRKSLLPKIWPVIDTQNIWKTKNYYLFKIGPGRGGEGILKGGKKKIGPGNWENNSQNNKIK